MKIVFLFFSFLTFSSIQFVQQQPRNRYR
jgi:hypothetical protein